MAQGLTETLAETALDGSAMKSSIAKSGRRWWLLPVIALVLAAAAFAFWLFDHLRPHDGYFVRRRGSMVSAQVTPEDTPGGAFRSVAVRVTADTGLTVDLRVLRPAGPTQAVPLVVLLGGHRTGRDAVDLVGNPGAMVVAALDYPYHGPEKPRGWQILSSIPAIRRGLLDTPPAVSLALDWLAEQPEVDRTRIELVGVSLGVPFAAVAGAADPRFRRIWLIHGGADNRSLIELNLRRHVVNGWWRARAADLAYLLAYGPTFEPERWVPRIAPRSVVVIGARDDERLPRESVERLYAAAGAPKELIWTEGSHINPDRPEIIRQLLETVRTRVLQPPDASTVPPLRTGATLRLISPSSPILACEVVQAISGDQIIISLGQNYGTAAGQVCVARKPGETLTDPASGEVLGTSEGEVVGTLEVTSPPEKISNCKLVDGKMPERGAVVVLK